MFPYSTVLLCQEQSPVSFIILSDDIFTFSVHLNVQRTQVIYWLVPSTAPGNARVWDIPKQ